MCLGGGWKNAQLRHLSNSGPSGQARRKQAVNGTLILATGFPGGSVVKNPAAKAGDAGPPAGGGNGNPLQYSYLGGPMDRGAGGLQSMGLQKRQLKDYLSTT